MVEFDVHWVLKSCNALRPKVKTKGSAVYTLMNFTGNVCSCSEYRTVCTCTCVVVFFVDLCALRWKRPGWRIRGFIL